MSKSEEIYIKYTIPIDTKRYVRGGPNGEIWHCDTLNGEYELYKGKDNG